MDIDFNGQHSVGKKISYDVYLLLFAACLIGWYLLSIHGLGLKYGFGFTLDDGWIHLTFAKHLVQNHQWSLNPSGTTGGTTSILWILLLAGGMLITSNGVLVSYCLNILLFFCIAILIKRIWSQILPTESDLTVLVLSIITICCGNLVWYVFSGMETLLVLSAGLAAIYFASKKQLLRSCLFIFLSALVRPEGMLVGVAILMWNYRSRRVCLSVFLSAGLGIVLSCAWNFYLTGTAMPSTMLGRRWIIGAPASAEWNPIIIAKNFFWIIGVWGYRIMQFTFGQQLFARVNYGWIGWIGAGICVLITFLGFVIYVRKRSDISMVLILWTILQLMAYSVMMPTRGHAGRYQPMVLVVIAICFVLGIFYLWRAARDAWLNIVVAVYVLIFISSLYTWQVITTESLVHFDRVHICAAKCIRRNTPEGARVVGFDIGALAYFSERNIIDLGGLIDPAAGKALYDGSVINYIKSKKADYLVMIFPYTDPMIYFNQLGFSRLSQRGELELLKSVDYTIRQPYWPGEAARVLANNIKIYRITWKRNER